MSHLNDMSNVEKHENPTILDLSASDIQIQGVVKQSENSSELPIKMDTPIADEHSITNLLLNTQENSFKDSLSIIQNEAKMIYPKVIKDDKLQNTKSSESTILNSTSRILIDMKKRKAPNLTVNLYKFVNAILSVFNDTEIDNINNKFILPNNLVKYLNDNNPRDTKKQKLSLIINDESEKTELKNNHSLMLMVVLQLMSALEKADAIFQFSKETFKYFLSTYSRFIVPLDFMNTNTIMHNEKKNKNMSPLPLGGLLLEYAKGLDSFISNMSRGDKSDILAFRLIIQNKIQLSPNIYHLCYNIKFTDAAYEVNIDDTTHREGYVKISSCNFKRATVLITNCIIMMYDGHQFVIPPISIEKDIQMNMIIKSEFTKDEYILLDILLGPKNKVLDIIDANITDYVISQNYQERLQFLMKKFPDLKIISITNEHTDTSYVKKKMIGRDVSYIYYKPNSTAAVIGTFEKHAYVAYKQDVDTLIVKAKCNISGPIMFNIATASYQKVTTNFPIIMCNDKQYKIAGDLTNINLLKNAIPVEVKDTNKLGNRSNHEISNVNDYKSTSTSKDTTFMENLKQALVNPDNTNKLIDIIQKSAQYDTIIQGLMKNKLSSVEIEFGGY